MQTLVVYTRLSLHRKHRTPEVRCQRTFLIIYTARDGSSAIINLLSQHPNLCVPLFEGMDPYRMQKTHPDANAAEELEKIFRTGTFDGTPPNPKELTQRRLEDIGSRDASVGFKWRFWGEKREIAQVLLRPNAVVFFLFRRDFDELISSIHLTELLNQQRKNPVGTWHPQFDALKASAEKRKEMQEQFESARVKLRPLPFLKVMISRARQARKLRQLADYLSDSGVPVKTVFYEDFRADNLGFVNKLLSDLGQPPLKNAQSAFQKLAKTPARDRVVGNDRLLISSLITIFRRFYGFHVLRGKTTH